MKIANRSIGVNYEPLVIAEIGINHNGSIKEAFKLIDAAKKAGVEVIKHQTHIVQDEMSAEAKKILFESFDAGITHFDLANNYGPPYGSAEANFGQVMKSDLGKYRDELIISSKAGYDMWEGPYGEWGSKKHIIASCDQSLKRMKVDYVDIFYSHRFDPKTPLEETADALESIYRSGKALYIGVSSYSSNKTEAMIKILKNRGIKLFIHQPSYSLINRWIENGLTKTLIKNGVGCIAFSPLAQGFLSNKYLNGIPKGTRVSENSSFSKKLLMN